MNCNNPIQHIDDLPLDAIASIRMLQEIFKGTDFEKRIPSEFLRNYNKAKEVLGANA